MLTALLALAVSLPAPPDPRALVDNAVAALQRSAMLRDIRAVRLTGMQHDYVLGNAERADGPWFAVYSQFTELRDGASSAFRRTSTGLTTAGKSPELVTILVDSVVANRVNGRETGSSRSARRRHARCSSLPRRRA